MDLFKKENENDRQFIYRLGKAKEQGLIDLDWEQLTEVINKGLTEIKGPDDYLSRSTISQQYHIASYYDEDVFSKRDITETNKVQLELIEAKTQELYKQKVKTADVAREYRSHLRDEARIENIIEAIKEDNCRFEPQIKPYNEDESILLSGDNEAIIAISDWHIGANVNNFYNVFNLTIAEQRINTLFRKVVKHCKRNNIRKLHILNLGDLLEGEIHVTTRVENELNTIEQIKQVSRLLYQFIVNLSSEIETVTYRSVLDNHSRLIPNFKDHIEKESFCNLIDWWVIDKLESTIELMKTQKLSNNIIIIKENIDDNLGLLKIKGKNIFFSHGHLGNSNTVIQDYTCATNIVADVIILGHWHSDKTKNFQGKKVFFNGSLKGVDTYALNKRLFNPPTQSLFIFDEDDIINIPMNL